MNKRQPIVHSINLLSAAALWAAARHPAPLRGASRRPSGALRDPRAARAAISGTQKKPQFCCLNHHPHAHTHCSECHRISRWQPHGASLHILSRRLRRPIPSWPYRLHGAPAPPELTHPNLYPAPIYNTSAECAKHNVLHVGVGRNACRTRVDDRHARVAGCGDLGRQSP